jgi:hypothetical protein
MFLSGTPSRHGVSLTRLRELGARDVELGLGNDKRHRKRAAARYGPLDRNAPECGELWLERLGRIEHVNDRLRAKVELLE